MACPCAVGCRNRCEPGRSDPEPGGDTEGATGCCHDPPGVAPVHSQQPAGIEARQTGKLGLDRRPDRLEPHQQPLPAVRDADRVGWDQQQPGAARERLSQAHPGMNAVSLGSERNLPHLLPSPGLRGKRDGNSEQLGAVPGSDG